MYVDRFLNNKHVALLRYCININKENSIIVDFKYGMRNKTLLLRRVGNKLNFNDLHLRRFLFKLRKSNKYVSFINMFTYLYKIKLKRKLRLYFKKVNRTIISYKDKKNKKNKYIKFLNIKFKNFKKKQKIKILRSIKKKFRSYSYINANTFLHKYFKKIKLLRFIIHKLLNNQVLGNVALLGGFLDLNLHPLFLKRFKYHFLISLGNVSKKRFNFNNFNLLFASKIFPKIIKFGNYIFNLSALIKKKRLFNSLYLIVANKYKDLLTLNFNFKYLNKFRNYMSNLTNVNYVKVSFNLSFYKNKGWRKVRRYLRKFKRINFFIFFNLAFFKLVIFLFLYWFNNFIIVSKVKVQLKGTILFGWFASIGFIFKKYIWRKKPRNYYLQYNIINSFIFLNYKNRLVK